MATDLEDGVFSFLLRSMAPLVVAPLGPLPPQGVRLRGVVRADPRHARVVLSGDATMASGTAIDFSLVGLDVEAAVDWLRNESAHVVGVARGQEPKAYDSHNNILVDARAVGFGVDRQPVFYDQSLFGLFSLLVHGGGFPWFEDVYTFAGFMLQDNLKCRIYLTATANSDVYGIEIPLAHPDGEILHSFGGSLPQELVSLVREEDLLLQPSIDRADDYCIEVFDMAKWIDPPIAQP
jgi:hypothetical protein